MRVIFATAKIINQWICVYGIIYIVREKHYERDIFPFCIYIRFIVLEERKDGREKAKRNRNCNL